MARPRANKRIFIDLNHPADFHLFRSLFFYLKEQGWAVQISARDKDCLHELLKKEDLPFLSRGRGSSSKMGKYLSALKILLQMLWRLFRFKPQLSLSLSSPYLVLASRLCGIPSICYDDTDINPRIHKFLRRATCLISPENYPHKFHEKHFRLPLLKELAYLQCNGERDREGIFVRLARADSIHHGPHDQKILASVMNELFSLAARYKVVLSSELHLEGSESPVFHQADIHKVHDDMDGCRVFWGNSATMAAESAVMGVPAVFVSDEKFCYIAELEERGLLFHYPSHQMAESFGRLKQLLAESPSEEYIKKAQLLSREKMNVSTFLNGFITQFPESMKLNNS